MIKLTLHRGQSAPTPIWLNPRHILAIEPSPILDRTLVTFAVRDGTNVEDSCEKFDGLAWAIVMESAEDVARKLEEYRHATEF